MIIFLHRPSYTQDSLGSPFNLDDLVLPQYVLPRVFDISKKIEDL